MNCKCCNKKKELRLGVCFDCANAESIIGTGSDMYDVGVDGTDKPAKSALLKLQMLIKSGWKYQQK